jgi:hypothetical protein
MNYRSLAVAAVAAWAIDSVYGFLVFGLALAGEFARYPGVFRPFETVNAMLPLMFGSSLIGSFFVAYIFAKGREGRTGLQEAVRDLGADLRDLQHRTQARGGERGRRLRRRGDHRPRDRRDLQAARLARGEERERVGGGGAAEARGGGAADVGV